MKLKSIQQVVISVGFARVVVEVVSGCTEAREVMVLVSSRSAEGRRCGNREGPQQVGVDATRKRGYNRCLIFFVRVLWRDLVNSGCAVPL
jgi:hypothetical protein